MSCIEDNGTFDIKPLFLSLNAETVSCLNHAVNIFCEIGRISMAARYLKVYITIT